MSAHAVVRCTTYMIASAAMLACSDSSPVAPRLALNGVDAQAASQQATFSKVLKRSTALKKEFVAQGTITPEGGTIAIGQAGLVVFFPAGAVASNLTVTITAHRGSRLVYSFEPHGTRFARPVAVAQLLSMTEFPKQRRAQNSGVHAGYLAAGVGQVDSEGFAAFDERFPVSYADRAAGSYVVFYTEHFSGYALASGRQ